MYIIAGQTQAHIYLLLPPPPLFAPSKACSGHMIITMDPSAFPYLLSLRTNIPGLRRSWNGCVFRGCDSIAVTSGVAVPLWVDRESTCRRQSLSKNARACSGVMPGDFWHLERNSPLGSLTSWVPFSVGARIDEEIGGVPDYKNFSQSFFVSSMLYSHSSRSILSYPCCSKSSAILHRTAEASSSGQELGVLPRTEEYYCSACSQNDQA